MFVIFHFGFEIFKIGVLAAVYSSVILLLKFVLIKITGNSKLRQIQFKSIYLTIAGLLFTFSFTYYGNHGLGDESFIPLGHWKSIDASDGYAYFDLEPGKQVRVDSFEMRNEHLCFVSQKKFYDYQLSSGKCRVYNSKELYETSASLYQLPLANEFKTFYPQYNAYWNGWRFLLLP